VPIIDPEVVVADADADAEDPELITGDRIFAAAFFCGKKLFRSRVFVAAFI